VAVLFMHPVAHWDLAWVVAHTSEEVLEEECPLNLLQAVESEQVRVTQVVAWVVLRRTAVVLEVLVWKVQGPCWQPQTGLMWAKAVAVTL